MQRLPDNSIDMILADLPYGTTACKWDSIIPLKLLWKQYERIIKDKGVIVLTASQPFTSKLVMSNIDWFKYELIWNKQHGKAPGVAKYRPMPSHESILIFAKGKTTYNPQMEEGEPYVDVRENGRSYKNGNEHELGFKNQDYKMVNEGERYPLSIINILSYGTEGQHPTQKPVELFEYLVKTYSNENELILDNVMGSGTTAIASLKTNRKFIGFEKEEEYYNIALKRIGKFDKSYYEQLPEEEKPKQMQMF